MKPWLFQMFSWDMYGGLTVFLITLGLALWTLYPFFKTAWNNFWEESGE